VKISKSFAAYNQFTIAVNNRISPYHIKRRSLSSFHREMLFWGIFLGAMVGLGRAATPYVCYGSEQDPYLQFGTKTSYEFSSGRTAGPGGQGENKGIPGCRPLIVWMVARHGARNPSSPEIDKFRQIVKLRDEINRNFDERCESR